MDTKEAINHLLYERDPETGGSYQLVVNGIDILGTMIDYIMSLETECSARREKMPRALVLNFMASRQNASKVFVDVVLKSDHRLET